MFRIQIGGYNVKKILLVIMIISLFGCSLSQIDNTPTKQVESFLNNYQTLDKKVLDDLDIVIAREQAFNREQSLKYRDILKKHYQNLSYEIKDETINGNKATVKAEIEVTDFYKVLKMVETYSKNHNDEFLDDNGNFDESKYIDYQLKKMADADDNVKYTLIFSLTKNDDGNWNLDDIDDVTEEKILGIYRY